MVGQKWFMIVFEYRQSWKYWIYFIHNVQIYHHIRLPIHITTWELLHAGLLENMRLKIVILGQMLENITTFSAYM